MNEPFRIVVCIKQVPILADVQFDPVTRTILRENVSNVVNAFDRRAMAEAARLKAVIGADVTVVTMGPPQAREALVECLAMGADRAVHLCDRAFAGSDTLATARALTAALRDRPFDLILAGRYSTDAETGQVGPELAELLGLPQITGVTKLDVDSDRRLAVGLRETDDGLEEIEVPLPALVTAAERLNRPGVPGATEIEAARTKPIATLAAADVGDAAQFGLAGSPTTVQQIRQARVERHTRDVGRGTPAETAREVADYLMNEVGLFGAWRRGRQLEEWPDDERCDLIGCSDEGQIGGSDERQNIARPEGTRLVPRWMGERGTTPRATFPVDPGTSPGSSAGSRSVWVVAEVGPNGPRPVTFELLGKGKAIASRYKGPLVALVLSAEGERHAEILAEYGADRVVLAKHPLLAEYHAQTFAASLVQAIRAFKPYVVLVPSTANGRDFAPRVAARLGLGLTGDAIDVEVDPSGTLAMLKPAFGGDFVAPIVSRTYPQFATVRPGILRPLPRRPGRRATVERFRPCLTPPSTGILGRIAEGEGLADIDAAEVVVCVGNGLVGPEHLPLAHRLAAVTGGVVAGTRKVVDQGWLPRRVQIGLTGRSVAPALYIGLGVSGGLNHTVGMSHSGTIVAINRDPNAPVRKLSDLFVVADTLELLPLLVAELERRRSRIGPDS